MGVIQDLLSGLGIGQGSYKNPSKDAMPFMEEIRKMLPGYFNPTIEAGGRALPQAEEANRAMMDPSALMQKIGAGYQSSPGFEFAKGQGLNAMQNAQAAGGMLGTPQHEQQSGELATNLANQDYMNYLREALGLYGKGAAGAQDMWKTGSAAQMGLGEDMSSVLGSQGALAFKGREQQNAFKSEGYGNLLKLITSAIGGSGKPGAAGGM